MPRVFLSKRYDLTGFNLVSLARCRIMTRVILAPNDLLTLFDLRAQNFRVNVEFSTCHRGQKIFSKKCPKVTFRLEKKNFARFFETAHFGSLVVEKISKTFFSSRRVPFGQFFKDLCGQDGYQTTPL